MAHSIEFSIWTSDHFTHAIHRIHYTKSGNQCTENIAATKLKTQVYNSQTEFAM